MKSLKKYRLTIEDESHLKEIVSSRFSLPVVLLLSALTVLVLLTLSGLIIATTPLRTLLPGYLKESQRSASEESLMRLDSLMASYEKTNAFIANYFNVLDTDRIPADSAAMTPVSRELSTDSLMTSTAAERAFVSQMEESERFNVSVLAPLAAESMMFFPVTGDGVFAKESETSEEGVIILPREENVSCAADGAVIASYYSAADGGHVVVVQHNHGFVTSYSHVGLPMVGVGDNISAGQIIAMSPPPNAQGRRNFLVRMWHNGLPIVPYDYISDPLSGSKVESQRYETPRGKI